MSSINFSAQEDWTVTDLQVFFHQLNILYNRLHVINSLKPGRKAKLASILSGSLSQVPEEEQLLVGLIEIHSPAKFSLKGADRIVGQVRGLIKDFWYDNSSEKKRKNQEFEHRGRLNEIELAKQRTELINQQVEVLRNAGFSDEEIQENIRKLTDPLEKISTVMQQRKVLLIEDDEST